MLRQPRHCLPAGEGLHQRDRNIGHVLRAESSGDERYVLREADLQRTVLRQRQLRFPRHLLLGAIVNGTCCPGGILAAVCNGQCCTGACTSNGSCCATNTGATVCGTACCPSGQICTDASTSTCASPTTPTLILTSPTLGTFEGRSGGPVVNVNSSQSIVVNGEAWDPGTVTLSANSVGGLVIATPTATGTNGSATFSVTINTSVFNTGSQQLVGWQTVGGTTLQAVVLLNVTPLQ
jgi:hypothetical protein